MLDIPNKQTRALAGQSNKIVWDNNRYVQLSAFDWEGQRVNLRLLVIGLCSQQIRAGPLSSIQYRQEQFFGEHEFLCLLI